MTADVKVARHFLHGERADQSAAVVLLEGFLGGFKLFLLVWLSEELEVCAINLPSI
jgi:hypothetical protein